jgi:hypothetical protein
MATAFAAALDALFADPHLARDVVYIAQDDTPRLVRAILRRPDDVTSFGKRGSGRRQPGWICAWRTCLARAPATASKSTAKLS